MTVGMGPSRARRIDLLPVSNRMLSRRTLMGTAAAVIGGGAFIAAGQVASAQTAPTYLRTTTDLNLRSGAGLSFSVVLVIPANALVTATDEIANGYRRVDYQGTAGWASTDFLVESNGPSGDIAPYDGEALVPVNTNLRNAPSTAAGIITVVLGGNIVETSPTTQNGFRAVRFNGTAGWMLDLALEPVPEDPGEPGEQPAANGATTADLNLRESADLTAAIITVMPTGSRLFVSDQRVNGFAFVTIMGVSGWAAVEFLALDGTTPPPSGQTGTGTTALNLRAAPSLGAAILLVMPQGATVTWSTTVNSGFRQVTYQGTTGWAADEYLDPPGSSSPTDPPPGGGEGSVPAIITADVNLRAEADWSSAVLTVLDAGTPVIANDAFVDNLQSVTVVYDDGSTIDGWVYEIYVEYR